MERLAIDSEDRERALARLKRKDELRRHVFAYLLVNGALIVIWAVMGAHFFWPVFPLLGWGIGLTFHAYDTFAAAQFTEDQIQREIERIRIRA
jgi:hypothetical protein